MKKALFTKIGLPMVGVVLLLSGCGGGGDESAEAPPPREPEPTVLTQSELVSDADAICAEVNAAIGTIESATVSDPAVRDSQKADIYSGLADSLADLGTPSDGEPPTAVISAARALAEAPAGTFDSALQEFQTAADEYGLSTCAEDPEAPSGVDGGADGDATTGSGAGAAPTPAPAPAPSPGGGTGGGASPSAPSGGGGGAAPSGGISPG